jgi:hypothetical protein
MKINVSVNLVGVDRITPLMENGKVLTLAEVSIAAVLTPIENDSSTLKMNKYEIFKKIADNKGGIVDLTAEEITIIKNASGKVHPPLIMGQLYDFIENTKSVELKSSK